MVKLGIKSFFVSNKFFFMVFREDFEMERDEHMWKFLREFVNELFYGFVGLLKWSESLKFY